MRTARLMSCVMRTKSVAAVVVMVLTLGGVGVAGFGVRLLLAQEKPATLTPAGDLKVKKEHPRIWLTDEVMGRLKQDPTAAARIGNQQISEALRYQLTKDRAIAQELIADALAWRAFGKPGSPLEEERQVVARCVASDNYRWSESWPIIVYDWCYDQWTEVQKKEFIEHWNWLVEAFNKKSWGGVGQPVSNYYSGYLRNSALYGLATFGDNPRAREFYDHARVTRWQGSSLPFFSRGRGRGGANGEGSEYDTAVYYYVDAINGVRTATGEEWYKDTNFFRENIYWMIYLTTPAPTQGRDPQKARFYQQVSFNDYEHGAFPPAARYRGVVAGITRWFEGERAAEYANGWLGRIGRSERRLTITEVLYGEGPFGKVRPPTDLPLAYYAPGLDFAIARSSWDDACTMLAFENGRSHGGHGHRAAGTFQMWRKGCWLTKESTGYSTTFNGPNGPVSSAAHESHNGLLVNGQGEAYAHHLDKRPECTMRLEDHPEYFYNAVDTTKEYLNSIKRGDRQYPNFALDRMVREYVFLRPDTLIILDRMDTPNAQDKKTFLIHLQRKPEVRPAGKDKGLTEVNGDQKLTLWTLYPEEVSYTVTGEGEGTKLSEEWKQWRVDITQSGTTESCFLHVLVGSDAADQDLPKCESLQGDDKLGVKLLFKDHAATIDFSRGEKALGGHITVERGGKKSVDHDLYDKVQGIRVDADGVHWEPQGPGTGKP